MILGRESAVGDDIQENKDKIIRVSMSGLPGCGGFRQGG
jgi:hypothetical protein